MTAQIPERIFIDNKPHWLHARPLDHLLAERKAEITAPDAWTTACHRQYIGTWGVADGRLWLVALSTFGGEELPLSETMHIWFLRLVPADRFPIYAEWFNGCLRVPIGPRLVQGFHGWSSWFTRERVITCRQGRVVRDREVDTLAMLEWALRRREALRQSLDPEDTPGGPRGWIADDDYEHLRGDWWPPGWADQNASAALGSWFVSGTWFRPISLRAQESARNSLFPWTVALNLTLLRGRFDAQFCFGMMAKWRALMTRLRTSCSRFSPSGTPIWSTGNPRISRCRHVPDRHVQPEIAQLSRPAAFWKPEG
jgi:hypothetical protein